jgi:hypothetical protein
MTPAQRKQLIRHARTAVAGRNYDSLVAYCEAYAERARMSAGNLVPVIDYPNGYQDKPLATPVKRPLWRRCLSLLKKATGW